MNLAALALQIGQRSGMVQTNDQTACKVFLAKWHEMIWGSKLWKDALIELSLPIAPSTPYVPGAVYLPTKGNVVLPSIFGNVLAVRSNANRMDVVRPMIYYRIDYDQLSKSGTPVQYDLLSKVAAEFDTSQAVTVSSGSAVDANQVVTFDIVAADGVTVNRVKIALQAAVDVAVGNTDRIESVTFPALQGTLSIKVGATVIVSVAAGETQAPACQRVRLTPTPSATLAAGTTLRIAGKRKAPTFTSDNDVPGIDGMEPILIELGYYDMLLRDERGGSPEAKDAFSLAVGGEQWITRGMSGGLLKALEDREVYQAASNTKLIPGDGFGPDNDFDIPTKGW